MSALNRTGLASIFYTDSNGKHVRIYYQDTVGVIRETSYDDAVGWYIGPNDVVGVGRINTPIASVVWDSGKQIRVYYFDQTSKLVERVGGFGGWVDGDLTFSNIFGAAVSSIAAVVIRPPTPVLEVYFQSTDGSIRIASNGVPWDQRAMGIPNVPFGSTFAATLLGDGITRRFYTTNNNNQIIEVLSSDGSKWTVGTTIAPTTNHQIGAGITCIANNAYLSVLVVTSENQYVYYIWNGSWSGPHPITTTIGFSAATCIMLNSEIHTYFQQIGSRVIEYTSDSAGGNFKPDKIDVPVR